MPHEVFKESELLPGQGDFRTTTHNPMCRRIEFKTTDANRRRRHHIPASHECPQAREQLLKGEGLGEVVISAGVEAKNPVLD